MTALCLLMFAAAGFKTERSGDYLQIALPVAGLVCASIEGRGLQYLGRYVLLEFALKSSKFGLGQAGMNQRPNGAYHGFPSGHTAAATFGATALIGSCLKSSEAAKMVALSASGFVGASRVEADKHYVWQVFAGALLGWAVQFFAFSAFDRAFRRAATGFALAFSTGRRRLQEIVVRA